MKKINHLNPIMKFITTLISFAIFSISLHGQNAFTDFQLVGDALQVDQCTYQLTDESYDQVAAIWNLNQLNLNNSFSIKLNLFHGCIDDEGADGMAFVLQNDISALGVLGGGIGYRDVAPSLAVEFDTYRNVYEPVFDHIAIQKNGNTDHGNPNCLAGPVQANPDNVNIEDCNWHQTILQWNAQTNTFKVFYDGSLRLIYSNDIVNTIFNNNPNVYWGLTGATGFRVNIQQFQIIELDYLAIADENICQGENIVINAPAQGNQYQWHPVFGLDDNTLFSPVFSPAVTTEYSLTITSQDGCTSLSSFTLNVNPAYNEDIQINICEGESYTLPDGTPVNLQGTYPISYQTTTGCDSTITTHLNVTPNYHFLEEMTICSGGDIIWQGINYSVPGNYFATYNTTTGCDSIFELVLSIAPTDEIEMDESICSGDSYSFAGEQLQAQGTYSNTFANQYGCDSLVILHLEVTESPDFEIQASGVLCEGSEIDISVTEGFSSYIWSTGSTQPTITTSNPGTYTVTVSNSSCEKTESITIEQTAIDMDISLQDPSCYNFTDGNIRIDSVWGGNQPYLFSTDGNIFANENVIDNLSSGDYTVWVEDVDGCRASTGASLKNPVELLVYLGEDLHITYGDSILLEPITNISSPANIQWLPPDFLNCDTCFSIMSRPQRPIKYQLIVTDENGCFASDDIYINVDRLLNVYAPTAFSPNNDGFNDVFFLQARTPLLVKKFMVFDRWGNKIFSKKDILSNDPQEGWQGNFKTKPLQSGTYIWMAEITMPDGNMEVFSGGVTLFK